MAILSLSVCLGLVGCGEGTGSWEGTSLKNWGEAKTQGGAVVETDNYLYFINGQASYTNENDFGKPVKGSLMVIKTSDFAEGNYDKAEIAVPKIFGATDYKAGLYVYGDYVYYGTPNVNKDASGNAASSEMTFFKTKLDGTEHKELFTVGSLSQEYRIVSSSQGVEILYYDSEQTAVLSYNVDTKKTNTIAKTDIKADESMTGYKFLTVAEGQPVVIFTNEVYSEKYYEEKAEEAGYTRSTSHGKVYTYSAGDSKPEEVINGESSTSHGLSYSLNYVTGNYVFYTESDHETEKVYGTLISDLENVEARKEINDTSLLVNTTLIKSIEEVYVADTSTGKVTKTTLTGDQSTIKETVLITETISSMIDVRDGYLYFFNEGKKLVRQELSNEDANLEVISADVASSTWYAPSFIEVGGDTYLFYLDTSTLGASYVKAINLTDSVLTEEDTDNDGKNDSFYFDGGKTLGKMLPADEARKATQALSTATAKTELAYEIDDNGEIVFEEYDKLIEAYNSLSAEAKATLTDSFKTKFENVKKAVALSKLYFELDGIHDFDKEEDVAQEYKDAYASAKSATEAYTSEEFASIRVYIPNNLKYEYQQAKKLLED